MPKQLHLGGFQIASQVTHSHAAWRHPGSDTDFTSPEYYHRIGRILERGKFDFVFFADLLADAIEVMPGLRTYELVEAGADLAVAEAPGPAAGVDGLGERHHGAGLTGGGTASAPAG